MQCLAQGVEAQEMLLEWAQKADDFHPTGLINIKAIHCIYAASGRPTFVLSFN